MPFFLNSSSTTTTLTADGVANFQQETAINFSSNNNSSAITTGTLTSPQLILAGNTIGDISGLFVSSSSTGAKISVQSTGNIVGTSSDGIGVNGTNTQIVNEGSISGFGDAGVEFFQPSAGSGLANSGNIFGKFDGVYVRAENVRIQNSGEISGQDGVHVFENGSLINTGLITSVPLGIVTGAGVRSGLSDGEVYTIYNSGTISGEEGSFIGSGGTEIIFNSGTMSGDVVLEGGNDVYRAAGDGLVQGSVRGGAGDDQLTGARAADYFTGGNGDDKMRGNEGADTLEGGNGRDIILGGDGEDVITGGNSGDLMIGGAGADEFLFTDTGDVGTTSTTRDEIRDFEQGIDIINLSPMIGPDFVFAGTGSFAGGGSASIRLVELVGNTFVQVDHDGDGSQDGRMLVRGVTDMTEADFIF